MLYMKTARKAWNIDIAQQELKMIKILCKFWAKYFNFASISLRITW